MSQRDIDQNVIRLKDMYRDQVCKNTKPSNSFLFFLGFILGGFSTSAIWLALSFIVRVWGTH